MFICESTTNVQTTAALGFFIQRPKMFPQNVLTVLIQHITHALHNNSIIL